MLGGDQLRCSSVYSSALVSTWKEHWGLITGLLSALFVALRILSAAKYDPMTAYGILQAGGTTDVLIGAALSLIGLIAPIIASTAFYSYEYITNDERRIARNIVITTGIAFTFVSLAATPATAEIYQALVFLLTFYYIRSLDRQLRKARRAVDSNDIEEAEKLIGKLERARDRYGRLSRIATGRNVPLIIM